MKRIIDALQIDRYNTVVTVAEAFLEWFEKCKISPLVESLLEADAEPKQGEVLSLPQQKNKLLATSRN